jgi:hypothetical protein
MDKQIKRKYNLSYKAKKNGISVNGFNHTITIRFTEIPKLVKVKEAISLITEYEFSVIENRQLLINFKNGDCL